MILLSAGHHPGAPGACYNDICEHGIAAEWISIIGNALRISYPCAIVPTGPLGSKITWINAKAQAVPVELAIELHFNSDESKRQSGSETLYCPGSTKGAACAAVMQNMLGGLLPPNRGAKEGWYRMIRPPDPKAEPDAFLSQTTMPALILEPEFIYNWHAFKDRRNALCAEIAQALLYCVHEVLPR